MRVVTVADVEAKLHQWQSGQLSTPELHSWAEATYAVSSWESETEAVSEVLAWLDMMDMNLVTVEDVPAFLSALSSPEFVAVIEEHFGGLDIEARKRELASVPMYAPFCKG